ncbi:hypothetical protein WJX81_008568 [Elliptochloris bilobata]|uniref:Arrestin C-terminal-like domain-containing protein n=1 Tax=Elliptochloris bilobata TaxID=381761 RepID=A0AAW1R0M5_9CHLO
MSPLALSLNLSRGAYRPGDSITATLEVRNAAGQGALELYAVVLELLGTERVDRSWVSAAYQADLPPQEKDGRREVREVLRSPAVRLAQDSRLSPGETRFWLRRAKLPEVLPPSFKGVSTRYAYMLQATAHFKAPHAGPGLPQAPAGTPVPTAAGFRDQPGDVEALPSPTASEQSMASAAGTLLGGPNATGRIAMANGLPGGAPGWGWGFGSYSANLPVAAAAAAAAGASDGEARPAGGAGAGGLGWREAATRVPVHLWPPWDASERRGASTGIVAAGEDAETPMIMYTLGVPQRDLAVQCQEWYPGGAVSGLDLAHARRSASLKASSGSWQGGFLPSFSSMHAPSSAAPPSTASEAAGDTEASGGDGGGDATAGNSLRTAASGGSTTLSRQGSAASPQATPEASLRSYNLRMGDSALVRVALHAPPDVPLALGALLAGTLDFRSSQEAAAADPASPRCVQVAVLLETEECVHERWRTTPPARAHAAAIRKVWGEHAEVTADLVLSHFLFSLPLDAPPSFATQLVSLRWLLRFELTTSVAVPAGGWLSGGTRAPEKISWALPILVRPPSGA